MNVRHGRGGIAFLLVALIGSAASAQCAEGRVVTEMSAGRCCWPGQHWNTEAARCEGPPTCPAGRFASGDDCVAPTATPPAPTGPEGWQPPPAPAGPQEWQPPPSQGRRVVGSRMDEGFLIAGGVTLGVGYLYSLIVGSIFLPVGGWLMYIPVLGGYVWPAFGLGGVIFGLPGAGVQTVGLVLLIVGLASNHPVYEDGYGELAPGTPRVVAGPGEAGLGLAWVF